MNNYITIIRLSIYLSFTAAAYSQTFKDEEAAKLADATNFTVPSSVAFNLLDVNPTQVHRPGYAKDLKLDWVIKDSKIVSNIAIEAQPIWLFFYKDTDYSKFSKEKYFERVLSSLTVSFGTATKDSVRSLAWGLKVNLYSKNNPVYDTNHINKIADFIADDELITQIDSLEGLYDLTMDKKLKKTYKEQLDDLKQQYAEKEKEHFSAMEKYKQEYEKANWNNTIIDLGVGQIFNYFSESVESIESVDSLQFASRGAGIWVSGNFGVGKKILINGMAKYTEIAGKDMTSVGANFRYGGLNTNFFIEGLYNFSSEDNLEKISLAYGGELKLLQAVILQFGLRTAYNEDFEFKNLTPIVNFNYLLN